MQSLQVSSGFIDASSMQLVTKAIKQCVELVKRNSEKGAVEEKENDAVEKNIPSSETSHHISTEDQVKIVPEEIADQTQNQTRSTTDQQATPHQQQSVQQAQSQQQQQQQQQPQQKIEPENHEIRSRQNSANDESAGQLPAKVTVSNRSVCLT